MSEIIEVLNANNPKYWIDVKDRAANRKGLKILKELNENIWKGIIYEEYVENILRNLKKAASEAGIINQEKYNNFKKLCVETLELDQQLLNDNESEISDLSYDAIKEAKRCVEGQIPE